MRVCMCACVCVGLPTCVRESVRVRVRPYKMATVSWAAATADHRRCCRCNRAAKCVRCACVRAGKPCTSFLPGDSGKFQNSPSLDPTPSTATEPAAAAIHPPEAPRTTTPQAACAPNPSPTDPMSGLPSLSHVLGTHVSTLSHVPKGARDSWSRALCNAPSSICDEPNDHLFVEAFYAS